MFFFDLTNFSKAICLKDIDSYYFFGFAKHFWIVPFRLPKGSIFIEVQIMDLIVSDKGMSL